MAGERSTLGERTDPAGRRSQRRRVARSTVGVMRHLGVSLVSFLVFAWAAVPAAAGDHPLELEAATFLGGSSGGENLREVVVDTDGTVIVAGHPAPVAGDMPADRVTTFGPLGGSDVWVARLSADLTDLLWVTIVGGTGQDRGYGVAIDPAGDILVAGQTSEPDFPTTTGAFDTVHNGGNLPPGNPHGRLADAYCFKLSADGSTLVWSTFLGGTDIDGARGGVAVDGLGHPFVVGFTDSPDFVDLLDDVGQPVNPAKVNSFHGGASDAFITKLAPDGSAVVWSRFLGGSDDPLPGAEVVVGADVDGQNRPLVHAIVRSTDATVTQGLRAFAGGESDAWIARLSADGTSLEWATYLGGSAAEFGEHRMQVDDRGHVVVSGFTSSGDFPVVAAAQPLLAGGGDAFLTELDASGQIVWSTYAGGTGDESAFGPARDGAGRVVIAGSTDSADLPVTAGAIHTAQVGARSLFVQLYSAGGGLLASSYLTGGGDDEGRYGTIAPDGRILLVGGTLSTDLPTTPGAWQETHAGGGSDAFVVAIQPALFADGFESGTTDAW